MTKKYKLSDKCENGFYRIIALRDIPRHNVKADYIGGFISGEHNLNQEGDCWIGHNARVYNNALVCDNAIVLSYSKILTKVGGITVIDGTTCLGSGTWIVTPKVIHGSRYDVIYNDKQIAIGCECHPLEWWEENGLKVAVEDGFSPDEIEEHREYLDAIKKEYVNNKDDHLLKPPGL